MKLVTKISLAVATLIVTGSSAAFADDPQLPNRLAMQQSQNLQSAPAPSTTTVAVYANHRGLGSTDVGPGELNFEARFEVRTNAHGQTFGLWVSSPRDLQ